VSSRLNTLTGATGLLGSHIAEQLAQRGERVRALVRRGSDTAFLRSIGAELIEGDLTDLASIRRAVAGADVVYHCAAQVGDWGPWRRFRENVIEATGRLLEACRQERVGRVLHVSSIMVYGHPTPRGGALFDETEPLGQHLWMWEHYARAKLAAEELCRAYPGPLTIARPSWMYGPRDRNTFPSFVKALRAGRVRLLGKGANAINIIYAGDVADGAIRAATAPHAVGQAYNFSSAGELTQKQLLNWLTDALGYPRVARSISVRLAFLGGLLSEVIGKMIFLKRRPHVTRYAVALVGRSTLYSTAKAQSQLGWQPRVKAEEGLRLTLDWFRAQPVNSELLTLPRWAQATSGASETFAPG
jgi:nucleoside-diphosphate-sugar epimerase